MIHGEEKTRCEDTDDRTAELHISDSSGEMMRQAAFLRRLGGFKVASACDGLCTPTGSYVASWPSRDPGCQRSRPLQPTEAVALICYVPTRSGQSLLPWVEGLLGNFDGNKGIDIWFSGGRRSSCLLSGIFGILRELVPRGSQGSSSPEHGTFR